VRKRLAEAVDLKFPSFARGFGSQLRLFGDVTGRVNIALRSGPPIVGCLSGRIAPVEICFKPKMFLL